MARLGILAVITSVGSGPASRSATFDRRCLALPAYRPRRDDRATHKDERIGEGGRVPFPKTLVET